jgi:hypothetical protein
MPNNAQKEVQTQTQTNGIAPFLIGVDLSSVLTAITDLRSFFMDKFLITTKQLELLTASIDAVKASVDDESAEIKVNLQSVIDALKVPDADISAQVAALESIQSGVDALSNTIVVDVPVVEAPVEPDPEVPTEPPVL